MSLTNTLLIEALPSGVKSLCVYGFGRFVTAVILVFLPMPEWGQVPTSWVKDGSFELSPFSNGWVIDPSLASAGKAYRSTTAVVSGRFSLEVVPNAGNTSPTRLQSFGAEQFFPADALRGKPVYFSGNLWATPGATAFLRVWTIGADVITLREVRQASGAAAPVLL